MQLGRGRSCIVSGVEKACTAGLSGPDEAIGASVDWDREYFTMATGLSRAVREAFVRLLKRD